jgi:hypothetical protein
MITQQNMKCDSIICLVELYLLMAARQAPSYMGGVQCVER